MKDDQPSLGFVECAHPKGVHRMAYWEWGDPDNDKVLLCVHGLTRSGRDFDHLARRMSNRYRVVCPDLAGRGASDWLDDPTRYDMEQYVGDLLTLISRLRPKQLDWVGSSMGGLIGVNLSARLRRAQHKADNTRPVHNGGDLPLQISSLVLNDIGPTREPEGLARVAKSAGSALSFDSFQDSVQYTRNNTTGFSALSRLQWEELCRWFWVEQDGKWVKHHDLGIADNLRNRTPESTQASEKSLWLAFEGMEVPILILRGEHSDFLSPECVAQMLARNSNARAVELAGLAHPPPLMLDAELSAIDEFLSGAGASASKKELEEARHV